MLIPKFFLIKPPNYDANKMAATTVSSILIQCSNVIIVWSFWIAHQVSITSCPIKYLLCSDTHPYR